MQQSDMLVRKRNRPGARRRKKLRVALRLTFSLVLVLLAAALSAGIVRVVERPIAPWQGQADLPPGVLEDLELGSEHGDQALELEHVKLVLESDHDNQVIELEHVNLVLELGHYNQAVEQVAARRQNGRAAAAKHVAEPRSGGAVGILQIDDDDVDRRDT